MTIGPPAVFAPFEDAFPTAGRALELACGTGRAAIWLARRGLDVLAVDRSEEAIGEARASDVPARCRFEVVDLDHGLPLGPPVDVLLCHRFRDPLLYGPMRQRLAPGGLLAVAVLSEVEGTPGRFRAAPGELLEAFGDLDVLDAGETAGLAWVLARNVRP